jgi:hypothetical protein
MMLLLLLTDGSGLHPVVSERNKMSYVGGAASKCPRSCVGPVLVQGYILLRQSGTRLEQRTLRYVDSNIAYRVPGRHSLDPSSGEGGLSGGCSSPSFALSGENYSGSGDTWRRLNQMAEREGKGERKDGI